MLPQATKYAAAAHMWSGGHLITNSIFLNNWNALSAIDLVMLWAIAKAHKWCSSHYDEAELDR